MAATGTYQRTASAGRSSAAAGVQSRPAARRRGQGRGGSKGSAVERTIFGVPERFMRPRLVLIATVALLTAFGCLMIYSASSISCLTSDALGNDPAYYLKKQLGFVAIGAVLAACLARWDYHTFARTLAKPMWIGMVAVLVLVFTPVAGHSTYGASRWITLPVVGRLQPSEFAKVCIVWLAAGVCQRRFEDGTLGDNRDFIVQLVLSVGVPLGLILVQPDKGTTMVICVALFAMLFFAGFDRRYLGIALGVVVVGMVFLSVKDSYSLRRIQIMLDPFQDYYKDGYQLAQGQYAFGSGGLFGVGIGMSRMKYSYLPMAHNDFIFAVIGEECGLVGTVAVVAAFGLIAWEGMKIARCASDLTGRCIAVGCTTLLVFQMLLNVCGVIGIFPLSGKPIPFLSYGGSSIMASLLIVGALVSVSVHSRLPETVHDRTRRTWQQVGDEGAPGSLTFVGEATPRSARGTSRQQAGRAAGAGQPQPGSRPATGGSPAFRVVSGGAQQRPRGQARPQRGRVTTDANGRRRIDLGPSATDRLRGGQEGPRTRR